MNVMAMLKPKCSTTYLHDTDSLRDGLHIMHESGYSAVPVVDAEGRYVGTGMSTLIERALSQNFVPMVDDRNCYIGIITRRDIIQNILNKRIDSRYIVLPKEAGSFQTK